MARIVAVKLSDEVYEELKKKSMAKGYFLVSDYVKYLIYTDLGRETSNLEREKDATLRDMLESIVKQVIKSEGLDIVDAEKILAKLERKIQDMVNPWTSRINSLSTRISEIYERIDLLEERIKKIENSLKEIAETGRASRRGYEKFSAKRKTAIERLKEQGVVFESDVYWLRDRSAFFEKLRREGAIIITAAGERIAVDKQFWIEFIKALEEVKSSDEELIREKLTETQFKLFEKLRRSGILVFEAKKSSWIIDLDAVEGL